MDTPLPEPEQTSTQTTDERLWTANDLARYIGCSVREIRNLRCAGLRAGGLADEPPLNPGTPGEAVAAATATREGACGPRDGQIRPRAENIRRW